VLNDYPKVTLLVTCTLCERVECCHKALVPRPTLFLLPKGAALWTSFFKNLKIFGSTGGGTQGLLLAGQVCYHLSHTSSFLANFEMGSFFMSGSAWTITLLFVLPHVAGMTGRCYHEYPLVDVGSVNSFAQAGLNHHPPDLSLPRRWDYR
jgi:hypothetical protein